MSKALHWLSALLLGLGWGSIFPFPPGPRIGIFACAILLSVGALITANKRTA